MQEDPFNSRSFRFLGVSGNHHNISHHGGAAAKLTVPAEDQHLLRHPAGLPAGQAGQGHRGRPVACCTTRSCCSPASSATATTTTTGICRCWWRAPPAAAGSPAATSATPTRARGGPSNKTDMPMANLFISVQQAFGIDAKTFGTDGTAPYGTAPLAELSGRRRQGRRSRSGVPLVSAPRSARRALAREGPGIRRREPIHDSARSPTRTRTRASPRCGPCSRPRGG